MPPYPRWIERHQITVVEEAPYVYTDLQIWQRDSERFPSTIRAAAHLWRFELNQRFLFASCRLMCIFNSIIQTLMGSTIGHIRLMGCL